MEPKGWLKQAWRSQKLKDSKRDAKGCLRQAGGKRLFKRSRVHTNIQKQIGNEERRERDNQTDKHTHQAKKQNEGTNKTNNKTDKQARKQGSPSNTNTQAN